MADVNFGALNYKLVIVVLNKHKFNLDYYENKIIKKNNERFINRLR